MGSLIKKIFIGILAVFLFVYVIRVSLAYIVVKDSPQQAGKLYPGFSESLVRKGRKMAESDTRDSQASLIRQTADQILSKMPLNDDSLVQVALLKTPIDGQSGTDATERRLALLSEAKTRNARKRGTSRALLREYILQTKFDSAMVELDLMLRIDQGNKEEYFGILDLLAQVPQARELIKPMIEAERPWVFEWLARQIANSKTTDMSKLWDLIDDYPALHDTPDRTIGIMERYIYRLEYFGYREEALKKWSENIAALNLPARVTDNIVYNPQLEDSPALRPFNWQFQTQKETTAEYTRGDGVYANYKGSAPKRILYQVIPIETKGQYSFAYEATHRFRSERGSFQFIISCADDRRKLAEITIIDTQDRKSRNIEFPIENCKFANVALYGQPGIFGNRIATTVHKVELRNLGE